MRSSIFCMRSKLHNNSSKLGLQSTIYQKWILYSHVLFLFVEYPWLEKSDGAWVRSDFILRTVWGHLGHLNRGMILWYYLISTLKDYLNWCWCVTDYRRRRVTTRKKQMSASALIWTNLTLGLNNWNTTAHYLGIRHTAQFKDMASNQLLSAVLQEYRSFFQWCQFVF